MRVNFIHVNRQTHDRTHTRSAQVDEDRVYGARTNLATSTSERTPNCSFSKHICKGMRSIVFRQPLQQHRQQQK